MRPEQSSQRVIAENTKEDGSQDLEKANELATGLEENYFKVSEVVQEISSPSQLHSQVDADETKRIILRAFELQDEKNDRVRAQKRVQGDEKTELGSERVTTNTNNIRAHLIDIGIDPEIVEKAIGEKLHKERREIKLTSLAKSFNLPENATVSQIKVEELLKPFTEAVLRDLPRFIDEMVENPTIFPNKSRYISPLCYENWRLRYKDGRAVELMYAAELSDGFEKKLNPYSLAYYSSMAIFGFVPIIFGIIDGRTGEFPHIYEIDKAKIKSPALNSVIKKASELGVKAEIEFGDYSPDLDEGLLDPYEPDAPFKLHSEFNVLSIKLTLNE